MSAGKQPRTMPVEQRLGNLIKRAEQSLMSVKSQVLRQQELTVPQYAALLVLSESPGISGAQLARKCCVTPQSMASLLSTLEKRRLVIRKPSDVHAKVLVTTLTRRGQSVLSRADPLAVGVEQALASALTAEEAAQLQRLLMLVIETLDGYAADGEQ